MSRSTLALHALAGTLALTLFGAAPGPVAAQSLWMQRDADHTIALEMLRPSFEDVDSDLLSGAYFLYGRAALSPQIALVGELPYASHSSDVTTTDFLGNEITEHFSSSTIGNPYVGMEARLGSGPVFLELGARPPLASEDEEEAVVTGIFSDVNRFATFLPNAASIQAAVNLREITPSKIAYRVRLSPMLLIPTEGEADPELFALYSFQIGYHGSAARIGGGMSGQALVTEDSGNLGQRTRNQLDIHADFLPGAIRPGLEVHVPLGDEASLVPVVVGVSVSYTR
jgi:hypothetical protein